MKWIWLKMISYTEGYYGCSHIDVYKESSNNLNLHKDANVGFIFPGKNGITWKFMADMWMWV